MSLPDTVRFFVLPIFIGLIGSLLSAFISYIREMADMRRSNREMQIEKSTELCGQVIDSADKLLSLMKHEAWLVAWRKATPKKFDEELVESDKDIWKQYKEALQEWRSQQINFETQMKAYFGKAGLEVEMLVKISSNFEAASSMLWNIYYASKQGHPMLSSKTAESTLLQEQEKDMGEEDQHKSRNDFDALFEQIGSDIATLSTTMIFCIQKGFVGNLRMSEQEMEKKVAPVHRSKERTEANLARSQKEQHVNV